MNCPTQKSVRGLARLCLAMAIWLAAGARIAAEEAATNASDPNTLITSYAEYWREGLRQQMRPIRVEIVVHYYDPTWRNFWGSINGEIGFIPSRSQFPMTFGDRVLIEGKVQPWRGLEAENVTVTVLERDVPITPLDARGQLAQYARFKERVVTLEAVLDKQRISDHGHIELDLVAEGMVIHAFHWAEEPRLFEVPQGTIFRLTGVYISIHDPRTESVEIDLWCSRRDQIVPIGSTASDDRFKQPLVPIGDLPRIALDTNPHVHIAGYVREYTPGVNLTLRDETGQITVRTLQTLPLQIGDIVEAIGDPFTRSSDWLLRNAMVRRAGPEAVERVTRPPSPTAALRMAGQILNLSPTDAAAERPIDLHGVILWCSAAEDRIILRDSSGGVLVHLNGTYDAPLKVKTGMHISGVTMAGAYAPEVKATRVEVWGGALLPQARSLTLEQAMTGVYQGQRIEMRGQVRKVETDEAWTRLTIGAEMSAGEFVVRMHRDENASRLTGAIVAARGVCQALANDRRQLTGIELWSAGPEEVRVEQTAPSDPFAVALRPIRTLRQFNPDAAQRRWARVRGTVTHYLPGRRLFLEDGAEGIVIFTAQSDALSPGDIVEATGLPALEDQRVVLREAVYRKIDHTEEPAAIPIDNPHDVTDLLESRLVCVQGRVINCAADPEAIALAVQSRDIVFPAFLPRGVGPFDTSDVPLDSIAELTGVFESLRDERGNRLGFRLQLRSPRDIAILIKPSWWTTQRLFAVTGALTACILIAGGWAAALRRRVRAQTEQIRAQLVKEANLEAHNRDIVANASDAIFTTDLAGRFTSFNPAGERMTGYTRDEALTMHLRELVVAEDAERLRAQLRVLNDHDSTVTFQSRFRRRDGGLVWVETSLRLRREGGKACGVLGVVRDVSERKQVEEELRRARDAAEANTQAKSAFLANMSHEIRTPMNAVIGMSNLLLDTRLDEEQREFACTIRTGAESLLTVLNDILDFSRIEAGKLHFETVDFDLAEMVDHTLEMLAPRAASKRLELAAYLPPQLPDKVRGDPGRLRQVLLNLIGNAVKFTEQGDVSLTVSLTKTDGVTATIMFEVRDTGVGMTPETLDKLFIPFSQADASMARRFGGTGLGLAISKQIVELMGGTIGAHSEADRGSTFWFTLPLQLQPPSTLKATPDTTAFRGVRLLAVHTHPMNRRIVKHYAEAWGMRCHLAHDAKEALMALRAAVQANDPFRVLLSDCHMSDIDGMALAGEIQRDATLREVPVILLTSVDRRLSPAETTSLGIPVVLTKPLRVPELASAFRRALRLETSPTANAVLTPVASPTDVGLATLRVLVAEDNVVNQRLIALQLGKLGCTVDIANHGIEVLEALERAEYDVVLMDCQMPEMDGFTATRRIRQSGRYGRVRIVAMTANAMAGDRQRCLDAGMDEYLSKPVRPIDLKNTLLRAAQAAIAAIT